MLKLIYVSIISLISVGCTPLPSDTNNEFLQRLSNTLDKPQPKISNITKLPIPTIHKPESELSLSIIELASINHCQLSQAIAKKNNQLGKVHMPSEELKYNIQFILQVNDCTQDQLKLNDNIIDKLTAAKSEKQRTISQSFAYMLFNEPELLQLTQLTTSEISAQHHSEQQTISLEALTQLISLKQSLSHVELLTPEDVADITLTINKLYKNKYISKLISSVKKQISYNNTTTDWLSQLNIEQTLCPPGKNTHQAQILSNIFSKYYLEKIQPYQAQLTGMLENASPLLYELWRDHPELSNYFNNEQHSSLLQQMKQSAINHVKWWQMFYKTCKIQP